MATTANSQTLPVEHNYTVKLAENDSEVEAALRLRFNVFLVDRGMENLPPDGLDKDEFDTKGVCDHVIVRNGAEVVGTYRVQTGETAAKQRGFYSAQEFHLENLEPLRHTMVELGRACLHKDHRNASAFFMLWNGIAKYAKDRGKTHLMGCSSVDGIEHAEGATIYQQLLKSGKLIEPQFRVTPRYSACRLDQTLPGEVKIPKLFRLYLRIGAKICGPPFIDEKYKSRDFLTLLNLDEARPDIIRRFLEK